MPRTRAPAQVHDFTADTKVFRADEFFDKGFPFAITRVRHRREQFRDGTKRRREFFKVTLVESGETEAVINDTTYQMGPGSIFVTHPDDLTTYHIKTAELVVVNILFQPDLFGGELERLTEHYAFFHFFSPRLPSVNGPAVDRDLLVVPPEPRPDFLRDAHFLAHEFQKRAPLWRTVIRHRLLEMLVRLSRTAYASVTKQIRHRLADFIDARLETHFDQPLSLGDLAAQVGLSKDRLGKRYKAERGKTVIEALHEKRVHKAAALLRQGGMTVTDVCHEVGFGDLSFFHRIYRRLLGHAPGLDIPGGVVSKVRKSA